jgi:hypothetical protein
MHYYHGEIVRSKVYVFAYRPCVIRWRHNDNGHLRLEDR